MGTYAVTGAASGMGRAVADRLAGAGHTVIDVDIADATVTADLATPAGRRTAAQAVLDEAGGRLDGAVLAAGLGPAPGRGRARLISEVNYFGVVELLQAWRPALAAGDRAKVVVFSSNSTTTVPLVPRRAVRAFLDDDIERVLKTVRLYGRQAPTFAYAASKLAVSHWVRRTAVTQEWAGAGIRLNAIAPGAIATPLLEKQLATPAEAKQIRSFPVPIGGYGDPGHLAEWVLLMLSDAADFLCGSVVFVDGGSDAWFRADDWPRPVPATALRRYFRRMKEFRRLRRAARPLAAVTGPQDIAPTTPIASPRRSDGTPGL
ncbi:SDR family oxidoreductase [Nocardioides sp. TF02-7]|uniref:SDR family oxidoreductase n=1 Tax=Nocardioides sp. TF02-7 TaxID=2917724 RepID=UPI001F06B9CC|nr:SDR family oxidoreductase [Nocardioides sp. TF02-7]UMG91906.1 SDR family oxidoreductase [Nocardioides sp. TF02-7]